MTEQLSAADIQTHAWDSLLAKGEIDPAQLHEFLHGLAKSGQPIYYPPSVRDNKGIKDMIAKAILSDRSDQPYYIDIPTATLMIGQSALCAYVLLSKSERSKTENEELNGYLSAVGNLIHPITSMTGAHFIDNHAKPIDFLKSTFRAIAETTKTFDLDLASMIYMQLSAPSHTIPAYEIRTIINNIDSYLCDSSNKVGSGSRAVSAKTPPSYEHVKEQAEKFLFPADRKTPFILPDVAARIQNGYFNFNAERAIADVMKQRAETNPEFFANLIVIAAITDEKLVNELMSIEAAFYGSPHRTNQIRQKIMAGLNFIAPVAHEFHAEKGHEVTVDQGDMEKHLQTARQIYAALGNGDGLARCDALLKTIAAPAPTIVEIKTAPSQAFSTVICAAAEKQKTQ